MSKEAPEVISYMVARTAFAEDGTEGPVEVVETHTVLMEANGAKMQAFMRPDTCRCWVERLAQKRLGEIMDKRKPRSIINAS